MDRRAFSWKVRRALYRHLSAQVANEVPVEKALASFRTRLARARRVSSEKIIRDVERKMLNGSTLTKALAHWAPADEISMISSGELSGDLPRALDLLISANERTARVVQAMRGALKRPLIYLACVYAFMWYLAWAVLPELQASQLSDKAAGSGGALFQVGALAKSPWALLPPAVAAVLLAAVSWSFPRWCGRSRIFAERFFPYSAYRDVQGYAWLMGFTSLLQAGMPDKTILKSQCETASPWLRERLHAFWWRMDNGASLSAALLAKGRGKRGLPAFGFPSPDVVDDIASMAGFVDFPVRITRVAERWAEELEADLLATANRIGLWSEAVLYLLMIFLIYSINNLSTSAAAMPRF
jgi:type II secretory pathway component PulF